MGRLTVKKINAVHNQQKEESNQFSNKIFNSSILGVILIMTVLIHITQFYRVN
jgi:hypothetical protein